MPERPLIVLLDGNALVHRAYHAIPPLTSPSGEPTNATYGFTSTLLKVLDELKPQYAAVAFDVGRTFRHEQYPEYKATRVAMPDDLRVQLDRVRDVVDAFNLPSKYLEGYEADDVLATLSKKAVEQGLDVIIVTGDTDTFQLIGPHVKVLLSGRKFTDAKLYDEAAIRERYGLEPEQLVDLKGLKGDASDNIPGVPGVGEVTATQLLQQFGSIENLYAHLSEVPAKLREKLEGKEAEVRRGKELVRLVSDLPIELDLDNCRLSAYDRTKVTTLFRELGFHSLLQRLPKTEEPTTAQLPLFAGQAGEKVEKPALGQYYLINTEQGLRDLVAKIHTKGACALDAEATSLRPVEAELVGISVACQEGEGYYIPVGHVPQAASVPQLPMELVRERLGPVLADASIAKYAHNANYDLIVLNQHGFMVRGLQ
ncbi:MAG: DNA polymerase I, partial [Chloroflexi bacterium]|nr:DNA polymerase I [Chloroflexota bacterium]